MDEFVIKLVEQEPLTIRLTDEPVQKIQLMEPLTGGLSDSYNYLQDKPKINDITLMGNKTLDDLDIQKKGNYPDERLTNLDIENLLSDFV